MLGSSGGWSSLRGGEDSGSSSEFIVVGGSLVASVRQRVNRGGKDTIASFC
jgi:hypothetical protein